MYVPPANAMTEPAALAAHLRARPFATLVSSGGQGLVATSLPTVYKGDGSGGVIECHFARANVHWKELAGAGEVLLIYPGIDAYVTPNWYPSKAENHKAVPTWNYSVVHAYGRAELIEDKAQLHAHVTDLTNQHEQGAAAPWAVSDAPESYIDVMLRGIVGVRITVTRLIGKAKLSQNRDQRDMAGVAKGLAERGGGDDRIMANEIADLAALKRG
ncbi:MAG TPA: FMN-binding negative transcriptional regulator [Hyphomicrobiaceae bacterium]|nr:FMN-binding negative transcriptional regulator [Hyphomicrobiaceae bacterium]